MKRVIKEIRENPEFRFEVIKFILLVILLIVGVSYIVWLNAQSSFPEL
jgi:hypothetical protein